MKNTFFLLTIAILFSSLFCGLGAESDLKETGLFNAENNPALSINKLTFDLLPLLGNEANVFFSPYSISSALAMTYAGASANTAKEISRTLYFGTDQDRFHPAFYNLNTELEKRKNEGVILNNANALWIDKTAKMRETFLDITERYYGAGANRLDFINETEKSRLYINRWVEEKTEERIKDILQQGDVTVETRLILTNAIYFLGGWENVFSEERTSVETFFVSENLKYEVPFMQRQGRYNYFTDNKWSAVQIPYHERELAMVIMLPAEKQTLSGLLGELTIDRYDDIINSMAYKEVSLQIPKFEFETKYNLKRIFLKLGMTEPFTPRADFSGMTADGEQFYIDEIIHQAFIAVEEKGTEAAAATAVVMRTTAAFPREPIVFRADRPFLFFIRDTITGTILFTGKLMNPAD